MHLTHTVCTNILDILISTMPGQCLDKLDCTLPKGIWLRFDFDDSHPVSFTSLLASFLFFSFLFVCVCAVKCFALLVSHFNFLWTCQDLPALYLQGGSVIPLGPPHQHVGESNPSDDLTLLVALDEHGKFGAFNIVRNNM